MRAITSECVSFVQPQAATPTALAWFAETVRVWRRRAEERTALSRMSAAELRDFGVTPSEAQWEAAQPFWRETRRSFDDRGVLQ